MCQRNVSTCTYMCMCYGTLRLCSGIQSQDCQFAHHICKLVLYECQAQLMILSHTTLAQLCMCTSTTIYHVNTMVRIWAIHSLDPSRSTADPSIGEELQKHFSTPYFIPASFSQPQLAWIFMGAPGPGASIHVRRWNMYFCCRFESKTSICY